MTEKELVLKQLEDVRALREFYLNRLLQNRLASNWTNQAKDRVKILMTNELDLLEWLPDASN